MGRRPFYSEYANHCWRFYIQNLTRPVTFKSEAFEKNWESCDAVAKVYTPEEKNILTSVYSTRDLMGDNVYNAAKKHNVCQDLVWNLISDACLRFAKHRGLV